MVPLFTGLFGLPTLLLSYSTMPAIPRQDPEANETISRRQKARGLLTGTFTGSFVGWFPGITSAEAGVLVSQVTSDSDPEAHATRKGDPETEEFIVSISAINTANAISNFVALFVILKARSGAARAAQDIFGHDIGPWADPVRPPWALMVVLVSLLLSGLLAFLITLGLGNLFANNFQRISYRRLVVSNILFLVVLVILFSGPFGLCIMAIATLLGLIPPLVGVKRVHLMGCLILPLLLDWCGPALFGGWLI
jgi:putative membrane protein